MRERAVSDPHQPPVFVSSVPHLFGALVLYCTSVLSIWKSEPLAHPRLPREFLYRNILCNNYYCSREVFSTGSSTGILLVDRAVESIKCELNTRASLKALGTIILICGAAFRKFQILPVCALCLLIGHKI